MAHVARVTVAPGETVEVFDAAGIEPTLASVHWRGPNSGPLAAVSDAEGVDEFPLPPSGSIVTSDEFSIRNASTEPAVVSILVAPRSGA